MSRLAVKKRTLTPNTQSESLAQRQKVLGAQISQTSGSTMLGSRDPVYHLANNFINRFDAVGKERAREMAGKDAAKQTDPRSAESGGVSREKKVAQLRREHDSPMYKHTQKALESGDFVDRFSSYAFNGGNMAAAVMAGKGKMMFTTCLSRALGRSFHGEQKEKQILSGTAVKAGIDGTHSEVMFNRDAHSAVGITLDAIRGASTSLEIFRKLANESGSLKDTPVEHRDIDTMPKLFPFMVTKKDQVLIDSYKQRLKELEGDNSQEACKSRKTLEWALKKENAVLERKKAEQRKFLTVLNGMLTNVKEAEKLFSADGFAESVLEEIESLYADVPPDDNNRDRLNDITSGMEILSDFIAGVIGDGARAERKSSQTEQQAHSEKTATRKKRSKQTAADANDAGSAGNERR